MMGMHTCPTVPSPTLEGCAMSSRARHHYGDRGRP